MKKKLSNIQWLSNYLAEKVTDDIRVRLAIQPKDQIKITPGILGMRFTKWLIRRREQKLQRRWLTKYITEKFNDAMYNPESKYRDVFMKICGLKGSNGIVMPFNNTESCPHFKHGGPVVISDQPLSFIPIPDPHKNHVLIKPNAMKMRKVILDVLVERVDAKTITFLDTRYLVFQDHDHTKLVGRATNIRMVPKKGIVADFDVEMYPGKYYPSVMIKVTKKEMSGKKITALSGDLISIGLCTSKNQDKHIKAITI